MIDYWSLAGLRLQIIRHQSSLINGEIPGGVIGNTWAFGAHIPGSSPGRVAFWIDEE
jgi:hypothetical protein